MASALESVLVSMARRFSLAALALLAGCASPRTLAPDSGPEVRAPEVPAADLASPAPGVPETCATTEDPEPAEALEPTLTAEAPPTEPPESAWKYYRDRYDADADGRITRAEYPRSEIGFLNLDANKDGAISGADFSKRFESMRRPGGAKAGFYVEGGPRVGFPAPEFKLRSTTGEEIDLASFRGKKPVALVFGSFT